MLLGPVIGCYITRTSEKVSLGKIKVSALMRSSWSIKIMTYVGGD
jgi:hypothetical protein